MTSTILRTNKLCKSFSVGGVQQHVLKNLDLEIKKGDFTVIMGSSGSGKSTLLYALSGMDVPTVGDVYLGEENITKLNNDKLALLRRKNCGFVFQSIYLLDNMNILDNVLTSGLFLIANTISFKNMFIQSQANLYLQMGIILMVLVISFQMQTEIKGEHNFHFVKNLMEKYI